jgi:hypothetical protein
MVREFLTDLSNSVRQAATFETSELSLRRVERRNLPWDSSEMGYPLPNASSQQVVRAPFP